MKFLKVLEFEFRADWATSMPPTTKPLPPNCFIPGVYIRAHAQFSEAKKGRLLGAVYIDREKISRIFWGRRVYVIPCGSIPKNDYSFWRIIHKYSYPSTNHGSVNSALMNTSVKYISFEAGVEVLARV